MPARTTPGMDLSSAAKQLGIGRTRLCRLLRSQGYFYRDNTPRHSLIKAGLFRVETRGYRNRAGIDKQYSATLVTGQGLAWLHEVIEQHNEEQTRRHQAAS